MEPEPGLDASAVARWRRRGDVTWRISIDRLVLAPANGAAPVTVHGSGVAVWRLLDRPRSLPELAERLSQEFGTPAHQVAADLAPALAQLVELEVLQQT